MNKPNLIYVFADQLRYDALGCNAARHAAGGSGDSAASGRLAVPNLHTPNLDAIAADSVCLDNCVSGHPVCAPYRASLFTGKYTTSTGMVINEIRLNPNHRTIAHVLNDAGYQTDYIGKWHLYANQLGHHYETKNSFVPPGPDRLGFDSFFAHYGFHHEYYAPKAYYHLNTPEKIYAEGYEPDFMTDLAISHLDDILAAGCANGQSDAKPFALFLSLGTPHDPWTRENVPPEYYSLFGDSDFGYPESYLPTNDPHADMWARMSKAERAALPEWQKVYHAMAANLDKNIGKLYKALQDRGLLDNTIFIFTSDHGEMFGAHGRRAKNIFYEEAVRVPFLLHFGALKGRRDFCFNTVDIMPTLLGLMGLPIPDSVQGTDLSASFSDNEDRAEGSLLMGTGPTAFYGNGKEWRSFRNRQYTYAIYRRNASLFRRLLHLGDSRSAREFLFDNQADPHQLHNLADDPAYASVKEDLSARMHAKMASIGDEFRSCRYYKRHWIKNRLIGENFGVKQ